MYLRIAVFVYSFLQRDAMHSADYVVARCPSVWLSIHPSVTRPYCVEMAKHIVILFSPLGSYTILVFSYHILWQYSDGTPLMGVGALNAGGMKNRDFRLLSHFIYKTWP